LIMVEEEGPVGAMLILLWVKGSANRRTRERKVERR
jgi:hypothetical protein